MAAIRARLVGAGGDAGLAYRLAVTKADARFRLHGDDGHHRHFVLEELEPEMLMIAARTAAAGDVLRRAKAQADQIVIEEGDG